MKNLISIVFALVVLAGCSDKKADGTTQGSMKATSIMQIAGQYDAKLASANYQGIDVSLILNPDSSFQLTEIFRMNERSVKDSIVRFNGKFTTENDFSQLRLKPASAGNEIVISLTDTLSVSMASPENPSSSEKLLRSTRIVHNDPNHRVTYKITEPDSTHNMVYQVSIGRFVNIHKQYLDKAPAADRAVAAFYASIFNTFCEGNKCDLSSALGVGERNSNDHLSLISKHLNTDSVKNVLGTLATKDAKLTTLQMSHNTNGLTVTYIVESPDGSNQNNRDVYGSTATGYKLLTHTENEMRQIAPKDPNAPAQKRPDVQRPDVKGDPRRPANQERGKGDAKTSNEPGTIISPQPIQRPKE